MVNTMIDKLERFEQCIDSDIAADKPTNMLVRSQTYTSDVIAAVALGEDWGGDADAPHPVRVCKSNGRAVVVISLIVTRHAAHGLSHCGEHGTLAFD